MKHIISPLKDFMSLSRSSKSLLLAVLISAIGNGIHLLIVGKVLYDITGSLGAFGFVILSEQLIKFFIQFFSGSYVDSRNPRTVIISSDIARGVILIVSLLFFLNDNWLTVGLIVSTIAINIVKPFYNSSLFSVTSRIEHGDNLTKLNILYGTCVQIGMLVGSGVGVLILMWLNPLVGIAFNACTFFLSGVCMSFISKVEEEHEKKKVKQKMTLSFLYQDWKGFIKKLRNKQPLVALVILSCGDFIMINMINLLSIPIIEHKLDGQYGWLFFMDTGFAIGASIFILYLYRIQQKAGMYNTLLLSVLFQVIAFSLISFTHSPIVMVVLFVIIGATNSSSISLSMSLTQKFSEKEIKGKVSSLRQFTLSILLLISIPIVEKLHQVNLNATFLFSGIILFLFFLGYLVSKLIIFKEEKLKNTI